MKFMVAALTLVLAGAAAPAAWAADDKAQGEKVAIDVAIAMYGPAYKRMLHDALVPPLTDGMSGVMRPEWRGYVAEAVDEELDADASAVCAILGRGLAMTATPDELAAGLVAVRDPAIQTVLKGVAEKKPQGDQKIAPSAETQAALTSPAGRGFAQKVFGNIAKVVDPVREDLLRAVMPGVFRRLGQKASADERRRLQSQGLPVEAAS
jgi:hypothetical protein